MPAFDFKQPIQRDKQFEEFVRTKEESLKRKLSPRKPSQDRHMWALVSILMLSLIGLGVFALIQKQDNERQIAALKSKGVAGVNESVENPMANIITAEGFSLVLKQPAPKGFQLDRRSSSFEYLANKTAVITSFLANQKVEGKEVISGIEVSVSEYDNKLDRKAFDKQVVEKLGPDFEIKSEDINIPNDFKLSKIQSKNPENISYYTTVTSNNYYVIKVYNQTAKYSEFSEISRFTDSILETIYLN
jgi:hypothetical protein